MMVYLTITLQASMLVVQVLVLYFTYKLYKSLK